MWTGGSGDGGNCCHFKSFTWWWCYPTLSERRWRGGTPRRPNSGATLQGLDQNGSCTDVSPPQRGGEVPAPFTGDRPK